MATAMTREESIKQLEGAEVMVFNRDMEKLKKAVVVAINALREPVRPSSYWRTYEVEAFFGYRKDGEIHNVRRRYYRCDECGTGSIIRSPYCSNCGAKMDGGADRD